MEMLDLPLKGLKLIKTRVFKDARGYFLETYHQRKLEGLGMSEDFVQDNLSFSQQGVLRGLHYQYPTWQGKLVHVIHGKIFDVAVDIRHDSPTFGKWYGLELSDENRHALYVPPGFAHGFCVLSANAYVCYKCTNFYTPQEEHTLIWNDPALAIRWPLQNPIVSDKDAQGKLFKDTVIPA